MTTRGPQVMLEGYARTVARGGGGKTMRDNMQAMDALVAAGLTPDGNTVDGKTRTGSPAYDHVVAQFPREELRQWEVPAPLLNVFPPTNLSGLPNAQPDGSPPASAVPGDLYNNGGFVCIKLDASGTTGGSVPLHVTMAGIPNAKPDGSPPDGTSTGGLYNNGGFLCIAP